MPVMEGSWLITGYDGEGRVTEICDSACTGQSFHLSFRYDADGRRTAIDYSEGGPARASRSATTATRSAAEYVDGVLAREYLTDESGGIVKLVIPTGQANPGTYVVVWNGHGDATGLWRVKADGSLERANTFSYGTWGEPAISWGTNSDNSNQPYGDLGFRFLYAGRYGVQWDGRNGGPPLYLMGARHYHAEYGRFLQPDPSAAEANLYGYAENNPVTKVDPSGLRPWDDWLDGQIRAAGGNDAMVTKCHQIGFARCLTIASIARYATDAALRKYGTIRGSGYGDAYRHCLWQCGLTVTFGLREAQEWGDIHEASGPVGRREALERSMDLHNNTVGRLLGLRLPRGGGKPLWAYRAEQLCSQAIRNGQLWVIRGGSPSIVESARQSSPSMTGGSSAGANTRTTVPALVLALLLAGCGASYSSLPPDNPELGMALVEAADEAGICGSVDLSEVYRVEWDHVAFIGPYTTNAEASQMLGIDLDVQSVSKWNGNEGGSVVVLADSETVAGWFLLPSNLLETAAVEGVHPAQSATFVVAENGPGYLQLVPPSESRDCAGS